MLALFAGVGALPSAAASREPSLAQTRPTPRPTATAAPRNVELTVFAAASLTNAYQEIGRNFEAANPGVKVTFNFGGSPQLVTQLSQGASADVFASANDAQMTNAVRAGRIRAETARTFVKNNLVVVTAREARNLTRLQDLGRPGVKVVLAARAVPVGQYALEFFDKAAKDPAFGADFRQRVEANVVSYEENVRAVLAKVALGEADAGVVYVSDVIANPRSPVRRITIPPALNVIATYPIAPVSDSKNLQVAQKFVDYMFVGDSRLILAKYGFTLP
jgi:molybdate transport system substrate-binding protein